MKFRTKVENCSGGPEGANDYRATLNPPLYTIVVLEHNKKNRLQPCLNN